MTFHKSEMLHHTLKLSVIRWYQHIVQHEMTNHIKGGTLNEPSPWWACCYRPLRSRRWGGGGGAKWPRGHTRRERYTQRAATVDDTLIFTHLVSHCTSQHSPKTILCCESHVYIMATLPQKRRMCCPRVAPHRLTYENARSAHCRYTTMAGYMNIYGVVFTWETMPLLYRAETHDLCRECGTHNTKLECVFPRVPFCHLLARVLTVANIFTPMGVGSRCGALLRGPYDHHHGRAIFRTRPAG